jgi:PAS domain S-box-containing protein
MSTHETHAVVFADADGVVRYYSAGAERLFGHAPADVIGRSLDVIVPPKFREKHWAGFHRAVATGTSPGSGGKTNIPVLCRDGEVRPFPGTFHFLTDAHGAGVGAIAIWGDAVGGETIFGAILPRPAPRA